ncbi:MAG: HEPN domain-containing protein [Candidatus Electryoneaceae bacterium]|nr:HEPN domain-containing protein [Candidatus Electryoneaceae bacterium]
MPSAPAVPYKLRNYMSLFSLLIHPGEDDFQRQPFIVSSDTFPIGFPIFNEKNLRSALFIFSWFISTHDVPEIYKDFGMGFPYVRERLLEIKNALLDATKSGHGDLLQYIGSIHRTIEYNTEDIRVRFLLLVSLIELLIIHSPDTNRYNVEDSINRQFRFKTAIMVHLQQADSNLKHHEKRLKQLYGLRSAIAHGDFKAIAKFEAGLNKKEGNEEYMDDIVDDAYYYLVAVLEQFLKDPEFVLFVKKS